MDLKDLFVSYKEVKPVEMDLVEPETPSMPSNIYINFERAQQAAAPVEAPTVTTDTPGSWKVGGGSATLEGTSQSWHVNRPRTSPASPQDSPYPSTNKQGLGYGDVYKMGLAEKSAYWMNLFANLGFNKAQQIAVVAAMIGECGLNPRGSIERKELSGEGNTKAGWANAGEGAIGFTHWSTKKKYIEMYNADPRRQGPKLSTVESEYNKPSSRHIADLSDKDQALIAFHFYKDLGTESQYNSFEDLIGDFYLQKAGRGFGRGAGRNASLSEQARHAGSIYQQSHDKLGYNKAAQINTFDRTLGWARELAELSGYQFS